MTLAVLVLLLIVIAVILLLFGVVNLERMLLTGIFLLPLQQALTIQIGGTLRFSDIILTIGFIIILTRAVLKRSQERVNLSIGVYYLYLSFGTILMSIYLQSQIQVGLSTLADYNQNRWLIGILTPLFAYAIFSVGVYLGQSQAHQRALRAWSYAVIMISVYSIIQSLVINTSGAWPELPGQVFNAETSFAFGVRRAWGLSIEPGAFAQFLITSVLIIINFQKNSLKKSIAVTLGIIAGLLSFSSAGLFTIIALLILLVIRNSKLSLTKRIISLLAVIIFSLLVFSIPSLFDATIGKISTDNFSKLDRQNNIVILWDMFNNYPLTGVGSGNYGALRNLFAMETMFPYRSFYDMPNVLYAAILGEQGIIGLSLLLALLYKVWKSLRRFGKDPLTFLLPLGTLLLSSSSITMDYVALALGMVIGSAERS